tara:strand:- start:2137 stop:2376 length:240 start_codon:yes stop_codon:yes gene_type:complete
LGSVGKGHFRKELLAANTNAGLYNIAHTAVTARIGNLAVVFNGRSAGDELDGFVLLGVNLELDPWLAIHFNCANVEGVK